VSAPSITPRPPGVGTIALPAWPSVGLQDACRGALLVDGTWFGTRLPQQYVDLSKDSRNGRIDRVLYEERLAERAKYAMRLKAKGSNGVGLVFRCPAQGPGGVIAA